MLLSRDLILGANDLQFEEIEVPEWGGRVRVRSMTAADRDVYEQSLLSARGPDEQINMRNARARLLAICLVDADGRRIFDEGDIERLGEKSAAAVSRVFDVAARLNALGKADIKELAKN